MNFKKIKAGLVLAMCFTSSMAEAAVQPLEKPYQEESLEMADYALYKKIPFGITVHVSGNSTYKYDQTGKDDKKNNKTDKNDKKTDKLKSVKKNTNDNNTNWEKEDISSGNNKTDKGTTNEDFVYITKAKVVSGPVTAKASGGVLTVRTGSSGSARVKITTKDKKTYSLKFSIHRTHGNAVTSSFAILKDLPPGDFGAYADKSAYTDNPAYWQGLYLPHEAGKVVNHNTVWLPVKNTIVVRTSDRFSLIPTYGSNNTFVQRAKVRFRHSDFLEKIENIEGSPSIDITFKNAGIGYLSIENPNPPHTVSVYKIVAY